MFHVFTILVWFVIKIDNSLLGNNQAWEFKSIYEKNYKKKRTNVRLGGYALSIISTQSLSAAAKNVAGVCINICWNSSENSAQNCVICSM